MEENFLEEKTGAKSLRDRYMVEIRNDAGEDLINRKRLKILKEERLKSLNPDDKNVVNFF